MSPEAYLGLGANLGNRRENLRLALRMLAPLVSVEAVSALYESEPAPPAGPPAFLNAACRVLTGLPPHMLLRHLQRIERAVGRHGRAAGETRPIDLDILLYGTEVLADGGLIIPHPSLMDRAFVIRPLLDIAPDLAEPGSGARLDQRLAQVGEGGLRRLEGLDWAAKRV